jgi:DNA-binding transcriptional regulator LsrR (DeoR family)
MEPDDEVRIAYVARRFFGDKASKIDIANELGISRFKVARLLDEAVETGVVSITINNPGPIDAGLSVALRERFDLRRAIVVASPSDEPDAVRDHLSPVAAKLLTGLVGDHDVLGTTTGRTVQSISSHVRSLKRCDVVQLTGVADPRMDNGLEAIARFTRASGGRGYSLYAPQVFADSLAADALLRHPSIRRTMNKIEDVTIALVTIGSWAPPDSQLFDNFMDDAEREGLLSRGVVGEVCSTLVDKEGRIVEWDVARAISITAKQLSAVQEVIAVGGGQRKVGAVQAVAASGLISSLVTDDRTARKLLS